MFDHRRHNKIKNNKILRWRLELAQYDHDIIYRAGKYNCIPDTLSRSYVASMANTALYDIHASLCHPGVTRFHHYIKTKNLPFSLQEVRDTVARCRICSEVKPRYLKPHSVPLIKATQPFERLSIDFKGPLPSAYRNYYLLTVMDEYSRFPLAFPCRNMETRTVIRCLNEIFTTFGLPSYIHSDRGKCFTSQEFISYLNKRGVSTSYTSVYNPQGNGQCERYNAIIWTAVKLSLKTRNLPIKQWQVVLPDILHSIRSLLCTATNTTPYERLFNFSRRSCLGLSTPTWLSLPGNVLLKRHFRTSKHEPLVDEVELIHATPNYARVRLPNGHEKTVTLRDIAPMSEKRYYANDSFQSERPTSSETEIQDQPVENSPSTPSLEDQQNNDNLRTERENFQNEPELRRSTRDRRPLDRLTYY